MKLPSQKEAELLADSLEEISHGTYNSSHCELGPRHMLDLLSEFAPVPPVAEFAYPRKGDLKALEDWGERRDLAAEEGLRAFCSDSDALYQACQRLREYAKPIPSPEKRILVKQLALDGLGPTGETLLDPQELDGEILCWIKQGLCIGVLRGVADPEHLNHNAIRKACREAKIPEPMVIMLLPFNSRSIEESNDPEGELWLTKDGGTPLETSLVADILSTLRIQTKDKKRAEVTPSFDF